MPLVCCNAFKVKRNIYSFYDSYFAADFINVGLPILPVSGHTARIVQTRYATVAGLLDDQTHRIF